MEDILGIGAWQAARVNERSEVMNELNKPLFGYRKVIRHTDGEEVYTMEASLLTVLVAVGVYFGWEALRDLLPGLISFLSNGGAGPGEGNTFGSTSIVQNPAVPAALAPLSPAASMMAAAQQPGVIGALAALASPIGTTARVFKESEKVLGLSPVETALSSSPVGALAVLLKKLMKGK